MRGQTHPPLRPFQGDPLSVRRDLGPIGDIGGANDFPDGTRIILSFARTEPAIAGEGVDLSILTSASTEQQQIEVGQLLELPFAHGIARNSGTQTRLPAS